jgi:hypothetical protein
MLVRWIPPIGGKKEGVETGWLSCASLGRQRTAAGFQSDLLKRSQGVVSLIGIETNTELLDSGYKNK